MQVEEIQIIDPPVPEGIAVTKQQAEQMKRGRGRPAKPFISEVPKPPKFEILDPGQIFTYLRSIPLEKLGRIMLVFYRYHPVCDATEGGTKDKLMEKIPGESHPFVDEDWESQILHRYGSGKYGVYLNEENRTICRCLKIETRWDLDNYPPNIDPQWVDQDHPQNRAFVTYLRSRGIKLPTKGDKEQEDNDMQVGEAMKSMTDTIQQLAMKATTPVPQIQQQPSMTEKLNFEMASKAIDAFSEKMKVDVQANSQQNNGLELVDKLMSVSERMNPRSTGTDDTMKLFMADVLESRREAAKRAEAAEERNSRLMEKMFTQQANPAPQKSTKDELKETLELIALMKEAVGVNGKGDSDVEEPKASSWPAMLIQNAPQLLQTGVQMWGQFNQSLGMMARMREMEALAKTGQLPAGAQPPQVQQAMQPQQPHAQSNGNGTNGAPQPTGPQVNPATGQPLSMEEMEAQRQEQIAFAQYHPLIGMIAQPLITHLNDPEKDGFDFAEWFVAGQGRLMYDQVKAVGGDKLMGAIKSYTPLWQQIGGIEGKVKQFVDEFLGLDEYLAALPPDAEGDK